ncbi:MAG: hypothetical protein C0614_11570, partial [Desulfuromonas sp.]
MHKSCLGGIFCRLLFLFLTFSFLLVTCPFGNALAMHGSDNAPILSASEADYPPYCIVNDLHEADGF